MLSPRYRGARSGDGHNILGAFMSLSTAVRRSYRYFLPRALFTPRKLLRQLWVPLFFYVMGLETATDHFRPGTNILFIGVLSALIALKWWAGPVPWELPVA